MCIWDRCEQRFEPLDELSTVDNQADASVVPRVLSPHPRSCESGIEYDWFRGRSVSGKCSHVDMAAEFQFSRQESFANIRRSLRSAGMTEIPLLRLPWVV